ncbi:DegT/DnrJ/EryC1/StrS family aminotransferase [Acidaminobacter sp. JC074]|uniref:DegT/DnrJ/EryC1/StrS family aminotransferase n=1 Tax=Acidaminobacter sp. JC074 TaxID=2530199 RepID=UPI001F0E6401|nr:DegT/DnrJ/EryC1/StrS family aminotransferase [Acidaminobacter sp. JC074]MCH4889707.1 DegT/DnrJ/EryC1/StrS family aminotransferase [Acidaminobacter sp. JC074]
MDRLGQIRFARPDITQEEINEVMDALASGWITTGPKTKAFEKAIADYCKTKYAVALNSATACMEMTLRLLGVGPGDEVITSAYTYTASASVIHHVGAKIVLVDTKKDSFHIDYEALENAITERTKVIIPVDVGGCLCDYDRIYEIIEKKKDLFVAENKYQEVFNRVIVMSDSAHSFGANYKNRMCGSVADFTCFSFHAVKNLTTGEGGAVTWREMDKLDSEELYHEYMLISLHGQSKDAFTKHQLGAWEYDIIGPFYKCNMTDIMAGLGLVQLRRYPGILEKRKKMISMYESYLDKMNVTYMKHDTVMQSSSGHLMLVNLSEKDEAFRNKVIVKMAEHKIATNVHFKPLPMHTAYKELGFKIEDYPNAYKMYENEISLPLHTMMTQEDVVYVCKCLEEILEEMSM